MPGVGPWEKTLPPQQYNNVIRMLRRGSIENVMFIRNATFVTLKRLGVKRNGDMAATKTPGGSDQVDTGSIVTWMDRIEPEDTAAVEQLVRIDATAVSRSS